MPSNLEMRVYQKEMLFTLLEIKKDNINIPEIKGLNRAITRAETVMESEDVAWVREKVAELQD